MRACYWHPLWAAGTQLSYSWWSSNCHGSTPRLSKSSVHASKGTLLLSPLRIEVWGNKTNSFHLEESHSSYIRQSLSCQELSQRTQVFTFGVYPGSSSVCPSLLRPHCCHLGSGGYLHISNYPNDHTQLLDTLVSECDFTQVCKVSTV